MRRAWRDDHKFRKTHNRKEIRIMTVNPFHENAKGQFESGANVPLSPDLHHPQMIGIESLRSGMITPFGIILRVDRCAPEHGGGILLHMPLTGRSGSHLEPGQRAIVFGVVSQQFLESIRYATAEVTGMNYEGGIR